MCSWVYSYNESNHCSSNCLDICDKWFPETLQNLTAEIGINGLTRVNECFQINVLDRKETKKGCINIDLMLLEPWSISLDFVAGNRKKDDPQFSHKDYNLWFNMAYNIKKKQQLSQLKSPKSKKVPCRLQHDSILIITQLSCHKFCVQNVCHNNVLTSLIWQSLRNLSLPTICTDSLTCFCKLCLRLGCWCSSFICSPTPAPKKKKGFAWIK